MALSTTTLYSRMDREFKILGITSTMTNEKADILKDAVGEFVDFVDMPRISASLSVTTGTKTYTKPATIRKILDVRDADGNSVVYSEDMVRGTIVLQDDPTTGTYTVYGAPDDIETNISTIVAAINTRYLSTLWAYVRWAAYAWAGLERAEGQLKTAEHLAKRARKSFNRRLDDTEVANKAIDTTGNIIGDSSNKEGYNVDVGDLFEADQ